MGEKVCRKYIYLLFMVIIATPFVHSVLKEAEKYTFVPRGLLIFLYDGEKKYDVISSDFVTALSQNVGPIIASTSLLVNVFSEYQEHYIEEEAVAFTAARLNAVKDRTSIALRAARFDPKKWAIKEINDSLYLLIPHNYLKELKINTVIVNNYLPEKISDIEFQLGIKINHMKTMSIQDIIGKSVKKYSKADYFLEALYNNSTKISSIFCTRSDYKNKTTPFPVWSMYMTGHGVMREAIAGLRLADFKELLSFFETHINMRLLIYDSCYAAGLNTEIIYNDAISAIQRTYSFPIITKAITDATVVSMFSLPVLDKNNRLILESQVNFEMFMKEITKLDSINYQKAVEYIFPVLQSEWSNIPQIKLPGVEWFSVMASQKNIVSIGSILSKTRESQALDVVKFFKTDPQAILLYAADIPFELIINSKNLEAILSMIPGDVTHTIKRISSSIIDAPNIIKKFMVIAKLDPQKIFFIEEINDIKAVIVYNDKYECFAYFYDNGKLYCQEFGKSPKLMSERQEKRYQNMLEPFKDYKKTATSKITSENIEKIKEALKKGHGTAKSATPDLHVLLSDLNQDLLALVGR